jgi:hypothetical protein
VKKRLLIPAISLFCCLCVYGQNSAASPQPSETRIHAQDSILYYYFSHQISDLQVSGQGVVVKLLPDDNSGSRHQRFILKLSSGQTLLIAHNIDIAPKIGFLRNGTTVKFYGEYEWNGEGGVVHWTHRDPDEEHEAGWLECRGKRFQ